MKILTKKLCSFMLLLALVVTVIPQPTKVSAYVNGAPSTVYMRIGEVCDLNKLVGKDFYVEDAVKLFEEACDDKSPVFDYYGVTECKGN